MTIHGIGVDVCRISRMRSHAPDSSFALRFFSDEERAYLERKGAGLAQSMAGMYAAKEAFAKAVGTGVRGFSLREVEVLHRPDGRPFYRISGEALKIMNSGGMDEMLLSISHDGSLAIAFAVGQGPDNTGEDAFARPVSGGDDE
ncbi:MAG: holo-ACP synthase [Lachnospiraceae bacterium]|nr:holo-ACP synthase [Lachnospiraceae bacterium]